MILRLQAYDYNVIYRPEKTNIAVGLSTLNNRKRQVEIGYDFVRAVIKRSVPAAIPPREIEEASSKDSEITCVRECVQMRKWDECQEDIY